MRILHLNVACNLVRFGQISTNIINLWCTHSLSVHIYQSLHYDYDTWSDLCECACFFCMYVCATESCVQIKRNRMEKQDQLRKWLQTTRTKPIKMLYTHFQLADLNLVFQHWHRNSRHFFSLCFFSFI